MSWFKRLFRRDRLYEDLSEEIQEHLAEKIEELVASGMSREKARPAARREFGNVTLAREDSRSVWRWTLVENLFADVLRDARPSQESRLYLGCGPDSGAGPGGCHFQLR
jgi:hypothetical protein